MEQMHIVSQRIGSLLCRDGRSVRGLLGIQSQFLRHAKWAARLRGVELDAAPENYFRAWTLRGTMHIHALEDYALYLHEGSRSPYMNEYWNRYAGLTAAEKRRAGEHMLRLVADGVTGRKDIISAFQARGASKETVDFLFDAWGGLPRILMEQGEIIQTVSDELSYAIAPDVPAMPAEQAELEQMRRYLEAYAPCGVGDAVYFFRYTRAKAKKLMQQCVDASGGVLYWDDGVVFRAADGGDAGAAAGTFVLPGFDPLLLGYEKKENAMIPPEHLRAIYSLQGIIKPVIVHRGRCVATWTVRSNAVYIGPFYTDRETGAACQQAEEQLRALTGCGACRYE